MDLSHIPEEPGVYLMRDASGTVIYVGKAKNLKNRTSQYFGEHPADKREKIPFLTALVRTIDYIPAASEREALIIEEQLIYKLQPFFNEIGKDNKTYPYLELSGEQYPRLFFTRKKKSDGGTYFGPYPKVEPVRKLLAWLRRIKFLCLRPCRWKFSDLEPLPEKKKKLCLYYHTGQCPAPCDGKITEDEYGILTGRIRDFLRGDIEKLATGCREKMKTAAAEMRYEKAAEYRDFLSAFSFLKERVKFRRLTPDYVEQATARSNSVTELQRALKMKKPPVHIECFDTSHLFGKQAVGSSVCFVNGQKCTEYYRHYKIEFENTPSGGNDFAMMEEIVYRRLKQIKRRGEEIPDLFVIDGGPGQLASAQTAMRRAKFRLPVISLAKRLEEVYFPNNPTPILLERSNPGLQLLQALRDEAHRFGITYHRKLRAKAELSAKTDESEKKKS